MPFDGSMGRSPQHLVSSDLIKFVVIAPSNLRLLALSSSRAFVVCGAFVEFDIVFIMLLYSMYGCEARGADEFRDPWLGGPDRGDGASWGAMTT